MPTLGKTQKSMCAHPMEAQCQRVPICCGPACSDHVLGFAGSGTPEITLHATQATPLTWPQLSVSTQLFVFTNLECKCII